MKGFGIEIKNNLLEPKHIHAMGMAVWLYMYLIDKMTSIDEEGFGRVLGGKPIKHDEVQTELGISRSTYVRWVEILRDAGYINTTTAPHGLSITVNKAHKRFGRKTPDASNVEHERCVTSDTPDTRNDTPAVPHVEHVHKTVSEDSNSKTHQGERALSNPYSESFIGFWNVYPRKIGKEAAWRIWSKIKGVTALAPSIIASVENHRQNDPQWIKDGGQFIPHPATYLNQHRWEDEITTPTRQHVDTF